MDSSRRSFDRSREAGMKRARLSDEPNLRDPRILSYGVRGGRPPPADVQASRYRQIERDAEADDSNGGGYHPTHQLFSELVSEYRKGLAELIVNSKPIITNLTIIAGENLHAAKSIAEAICNHIIEVPSEQKLPSLYLLDSIVKNIGRDYIKYFSTKLPEVFCKAYKQADPSIHAGLRHLFRTWEGVFPLQPLQVIEKELGISLSVNGSASARSKPEPQSQYPQKSIHVNPKYLEARQKLQPPSRVKGQTTDIPSNTMKSTGTAARMSIQHREPVRDSLYEKDAEVLYDDYDFSVKKSGIGDPDKHWYGTGNNMEDNDMEQRNGYDGKRKLASYSTPQSYASRSKGGMSQSWKNNEEEEYSWDDIDSRVIKHGAPTDPRKDSMTFDNSVDMESTDEMNYPVATIRQSVQSADYSRGLGVTSGGVSSSLGRKTLQPQMIRTPATGVLSRSQINNNTIIGQKRPALSTQQPTLRQRPPSPSFSEGQVNSALQSLDEIDLPVPQSMQRAVSKSSQISEPDNARPRDQLKRDPSSMLPPSSKKKHPGSQKSKLIPSSLLPSQQSMQQHSLPDHSKLEAKLSEPVSDAPTIGTSVAEAVQRLSSSDLLAAVMNSGALSKGVINPKPEVDYKDSLELVNSDIHPPGPAGLGRRPVGYRAQKISSQDSKPGPPVAKRNDAPSSKPGDEKTATVNPYSNILSTLMEKGLITSSKNESSTTSLLSGVSEGAIPGVTSTPLTTTMITDNLSASKHAPGKAMDNMSKSPEVRNLIGFEFKPNLLRQLHEAVIEDLIDSLPCKCNICGLRFKMEERLDRHMEWHSSKQFDNEYGTLRRWFPNIDDWVAGNISNAEPVDSAEEIEEAANEDELCLVPANESQCVCILCGELFEDCYSHEEDEWMFRGAMHVKTSDPGYEMLAADNSLSQDIIVHVECFTESSARELGLMATVKEEEDA